MRVPSSSFVYVEVVVYVISSNRQSWQQVQRGRCGCPIEGVNLHPGFGDLYMDDSLAWWYSHCCPPPAREQHIVQELLHSHAFWLGGCLKRR